MSRRDTLFGLPRYVLAILRHMETHSERLKWSLAEESNQLTLTLTWNFNDSIKPRKTKETLWKKLQRSLGLERHTTSPSSHSSQPDLQTPITRRFLLETFSPITDPTAAVSSSRSTFDGWKTRDSQLTVTSRCRSLPGRMQDSAGQGVHESWEKTSTSYRQTRARRSTEATSVPLRPRRNHNHHHQHHYQQQQQQAAGYIRQTSPPTYVTPSSHLTLPVHRSRGTKSYMTSQQHQSTVGRAGRHVSPSHFSWPGASFDLQAGLADDDEGQSSGGTQGAGEPTSPSLPSSTSTATNACTRPLPLQHDDVTATNDDVTPSNGEADTEVADVTAAVSADNDDVEASDEARPRRRRSCEFNLLDDEDDWTDTDWTNVICVIDDSQDTPTITAATPTTTAAADTAAAADDDDDDDDDYTRDGVAQTAINETVMKCIESCDKVLLRHSTAIR